MGEKVREMREEVSVGISVGGLPNTTIASCDPYSTHIEFSQLINHQFELLVNLFNLCSHSMHKITLHTTWQKRSLGLTLNKAHMMRKLPKSLTIKCGWQ